MTYERIAVRVHDGILVLTLHARDRRGAADRQLCGELRAAVAAAAADPAVRVLLLTGSGQSFCAGWNVAELAALDPSDAGAAMRLTETAYDLLSAIETCPKPVVSAVHGDALGFGFALALAADTVVAADGARFGLPELAFGVPPAWVLLRGEQVLGRHRLAWLTFTAEPVDARTAQSYGLVHAVVPPDALEVEAQALARRMAEGDAAAQSRAKAWLSRESREDTLRAMGQTPTYLMGAACGAAARRFLGKGP